MKRLNYQKICSDLLSDLPQRQKEIVSRRFGLDGSGRETLESIGQDFGICRERVRQIQEASLEKIKPKLEKYQKVFQVFLKHFKGFGDLKKEDVLLAELGGEESQNEVYFLLTIKKIFQRLNENNDFHSFWTINQSSLQKAKKIITSFYQKLKEIGKPLTLKEFNSFVTLKKPALISYLEISKRVQKNEEGLYGLRTWPEINPRGIKDKAYLVFKKTGQPLHFAKVADLIEGAHLQTVHNELIKDPRFVLVGRGTYALSEWGYHPGDVKDVIFKILEEAEGSLTKEKILEKVLKQRLVKENTVLLNLSNKKYFTKDSKGKYRLQVQIA